MQISSKISINEDLTQLNQKVSASLHIKGKATVVKSWSYEGKLFAKFENNVVKQLEYKDYAEWLSLPWPKKHGVPVILRICNMLLGNMFFSGDDDA